MAYDEGAFPGAGGLALYYQQWTPAGAPRAAVALIHGFGEHSGRYTFLVEELVAQGYAVAAFDLRGHGRSPGRRGHVAAWVEYRDDLAAFLRLVEGQYPHIPHFLYGHSMGGLIVLDYALHHPAGLAGVIASGPALSQALVSPLAVAVARLLARVWPTFLMDAHLEDAAVSRDSVVVAERRRDRAVFSKGSVRLGMELLAAAAWTLAQAHTMSVPLLILHGEADRVVPPDASRLFYERVTLADKQRIVYAGGYHEPHNDVNRAKVLGDVTRWLDEHLPRLASGGTPTGVADANAPQMRSGRPPGGC